jgi:hypothetical protein
MLVLDCIVIVTVKYSFDGWCFLLFHVCNRHDPSQTSSRMHSTERSFTSRSKMFLLSRGVLRGAWRGSREPLVNFWLITRALCYLHRKYKTIQAIHTHENIDTHKSIYRYILPVPTFNAKTKKKISLLMGAPC